MPVLEDLDAYPDAGRQQSETTMAVQSLGAAAQNMLLAAYDRGLDAGWMCAPLFCPEEVVKALSLDPKLVPHALLTLGYADGDPPRRRGRRPLEDLLVWDWARSERAPPGALQTHLQSGIIAGADDLEGVGLGWRNGSFVGVLLVAFGAALWGTDAVLRVPLLEVMSPAAIVLSEHLVLLLYSVPAVVLGWGVLAGLRASQWVALLIIAWGGSALATLLFTTAFVLGNPTVVILLQKTQPLFAIALAHVLLRERLVGLLAVLRGGGPGSVPYLLRRPRRALRGARVSRPSRRSSL